MYCLIIYGNIIIDIPAKITTCSKSCGSVIRQFDVLVHYQFIWRYEVQYAFHLCKCLIRIAVVIQIKLIYILHFILIWADVIIVVIYIIVFYNSLTVSYLFGRHNIEFYPSGFLTINVSIINYNSGSTGIFIVFYDFYL